MAAWNAMMMKSCSSVATAGGAMEPKSQKNLLSWRAAQFPLERKFAAEWPPSLASPNRVSLAGAAKTRALTSSTVSTKDSVDVSYGRLAHKFIDLKQRGKVALIAYITAGDPNLETTEQAVKALEASGADIIEIGVPYSDPLADGPVIQAAATRALKRGTTLDSVLEMLKRVTPSLNSPIVVFSYYNMILKRGPENFAKALSAAGVSGILVPDIPLEETHHLRQFTSANGIELVLLTTPTTPSARMEAIAKASQGFIYLVSLTGVTGARPMVDSKVKDLLRDLKKVTENPIAVGFGISKPEHAAQVAKWGADGVIIGSAVVKLLSEGPSPQDGIDAMKRLISDLKAALP
ncbi:hypothetical protein O6H91_05G101300 [Diphasiastrum complanatum]|uniref:Uncharacterized protein n=1 Tax=Diphasiastrum complanatum TaxID=34168 RepID=A0ACC2DRF7_DIPCM|nr:hypothetical protein O6H91_05G101300 [Diphasiastrum complanatum]